MSSIWCVLESADIKGLSMNHFSFQTKIEIQKKLLKNTFFVIVRFYIALYIKKNGLGLQLHRLQKRFSVSIKIVFPAVLEFYLKGFKFLIYFRIPPFLICLDCSYSSGYLRWFFVSRDEWKWFNPKNVYDKF